MPADFPPETTFDDVLIKIRTAKRNKNVGKVPQTVLKPGPRSYKTATMFEILDESGHHHHWTMTIHTLGKSKDGWEIRRERYVSVKDPIDKEDVPF